MHVLDVYSFVVVFFFSYSKMSHTLMSKILEKHYRVQECNLITLVPRTPLNSWLLADKAVSVCTRYVSKKKIT